MAAGQEFQVEPDIFPDGYGEMYEWDLSYWKDPNTVENLKQLIQEMGYEEAGMSFFFSQICKF